MKRIKILLVGLIILFTLPIVAQQKVIDSLELQLLKPTNGLTKIEILNEISWYYASSNPEKGLDKAKEAILLATDNKDSLQLGIAYERQAYNYQTIGKDSLVITSYGRAEQIYRAIVHRRRLAALAFNLGNFHLFRSNYHKSLEYGEIALEVFESNEDTIRIARACNQIGTNYMYLGNYSSALKTFQKGTFLLKQIKKEATSFNAEILGNIGLLYEKLSEYNTALEFQNNAMQIYKDNKYTHGIANTYNNLGKLYGHLNEHKKALDMFNASYDLKEKSGNKYRIANALTNIGTAHSEIGDLDKALKFLNRSKIIYEELNHNSNLSTTYKNIGDIYLERKMPTKAESNFKSALFYAKEADDKRAQYLANEGLSKMAFVVSDFKFAFLKQQEALVQKETLISEEKRDEIADLKAKFEYEKEKAILQTEFENSKALDEAKISRETLIRNFSIAAGILAVTILTIGLTLYRRKKEADLNTKIARSKLQTLKAQMNPHFFFNSLNSINSFVMKNDKDKASQYLVKFSEIMRQVLNDSNEDEVTLKDEINFLNSYLELEEQRLGNSFNYSITVEDGIDEEEMLIPPALLQPFVENSIWHGFTNHSGKGRLEITFSKKQGMLVCTIEDNGVGFDSDILNIKHKKPFGTRSVKERIDLLNEQKNSNAKIDIKNKEEGVRVSIYLPFLRDI